MATTTRKKPSALLGRIWRKSEPVAGALSCRRKFLRYFPKGFSDPKYLGWERDYKWTAHLAWERDLGRRVFSELLADAQFEEIAQRAVRIESKTNLIFSFEKMALRDAVKTPAGARRFAEELFAILHGRSPLRERFDRWCDAVGELPRKQTRVLTWPNVTVFPFLAQPGEHFFLKPNVCRRAAAAYGVEMPYASRPSGEIYEQWLQLAQRLKQDLVDLGPRDLIDIQSFLWVQGSDEYP